MAPTENESELGLQDVVSLSSDDASEFLEPEGTEKELAMSASSPSVRAVGDSELSAVEDDPVDDQNVHDQLPDQTSDVDMPVTNQPEGMHNGKRRSNRSNFGSGGAREQLEKASTKITEDTPRRGGRKRSHSVEPVLDRSLLTKLAKKQAVSR